MIFDSRFGDMIKPRIMRLGFPQRKIMILALEGMPMTRIARKLNLPYCRVRKLQREGQKKILEGVTKEQASEMLLAIMLDQGDGLYE